MKTVLRNIVLLTLLIAAALASAGHWELDHTATSGNPDNISGGIAAQTMPAGSLIDPSGSFPYRELDSHYNPGAPYYEYSGGVSPSYHVKDGESNVTLSGNAGGLTGQDAVVTYVFKWHSDAGEGPPPEALVKAHIIAFAEANVDDYFLKVNDWTVECASGFGASNEDVQTGMGDELLYYDTLSKYKHVTATVYGLFTPDADDPNYLHVRVAPTASASITVSDVPNHYRGAGPEAFFDVGVVTFVSTMGGQIIHPKVTITSPHVKGLHYDSTNHRQNADFSVKVAPPDGANYPSGTTIGYQWSDPSGNLQFDNPHAQSTTAHATRPGVCSASCILVVSNSSGQFYGTDAAECAAIGGPITVALQEPQETFAKGATYRHDLNDPTKSWYLTYFNQSHHDANGHYVDPPQFMQKTQNAMLSVLVQPVSSDSRFPGTTVTIDSIPKTFTVQGDFETVIIDLGGGQNWDDPGSGSSGGNSPPGTIIETLFAEGAFKDAAPKAHFKFNDGVIASDPNEDITDDSADTMDEVLDAHNQPTGAFTQHVYKLSGHMPAPPLVPVTPAQDSGVGTRTLSLSDRQGATYWTDIQSYRYFLHDSMETDSQPMPGVRVQERFVDHDPLGLTVNQTGALYWPTLLYSTLDSGKVDWRDGIFGSNNNKPYDGLWYRWPSNTSKVEWTYHSYFAGSYGADPDDRSGVDLGVFKITFTPGPPNQPGTAGQTDLNLSTGPAPFHAP